ncbi:MAG: hypothetical protein HC906_02460 [Bacteroidales bacterium]|nr:hypothetical protein [Bacteroidales bacterium]
MNIHCIIHEKYEGIGCIHTWIRNKNHSVTFTKVYDEEPFPDTSQFDWLIIMGGSMSVYEEDKYPVIKIEKEFIGKCIHENKTILGICLGAQFLAAVLGSKVYPGKEREIGWFPILINKENLPLPLRFIPEN